MFHRARKIPVVEKEKKKKKGTDSANEDSKVKWEKANLKGTSAVKVAQIFYSGFIISNNRPLIPGSFEKFAKRFV